MEPKQVVSKATVGTVGRSFGDSAEKVSETEIAVHVFTTAPAEVAFEAGGTINLGNYESARFMVSIRVPCYREDVDAAFQTAKAWVEKRAEAEVNEIRGSRGV
jgi:hypothetical protein